VVGTTQVSATADIPVNGTTAPVSGTTITRATGTAANTAVGGSDNARKNWKTVGKLPQIRTEIHGVAGPNKPPFSVGPHGDLQVVGGTGEAVGAGDRLHDKVFVTKPAGSPAEAPNPSGNVVFHRYGTSNCTVSSGTQFPVNETVALAADGTAESSAYTKKTDTENVSYRTDYLGDGNYAPRVGVCERTRPIFPPSPRLTIAKCPAAPATPCIKRALGDPRDLQEVVMKGTAEFRITVRNTSAFAVQNVTVTDDLSPVCDRALGLMVAGSTKEYTCTRPNVEAGFVNVAKVEGRSTQGAQATLRDEDPSRVQVPAIEIAKCRLVPTCRKRENDQQREGPGLTAEFRITVTNTGGVALHDVTVTDPVSPECKSSPGTLGPGKRYTYTCIHTRTLGEVRRNASDCGYLNAAFVVGTSSVGTKVRNSDPSTVLHPAQPSDPYGCGTG
jgi:uncharacterized repeat protein (TIGR01451 family)